MDCIFCKIAAGEIPANEVYRDEAAVAFRDLNPQAPSHILVIPTRHIASLADIAEVDADEAGRLLRVVAEVAADNITGGYRVVTNIGADAGQSVPHLHFHILGGRPFGWPPG
ncbi:MAG TPA: histidine triad nucleotide-binding protein [Armatimonadota bacterium]|jgi:histidine triad (HIT) family protein